MNFHGCLPGIDERAAGMEIIRLGPEGSRKDRNRIDAPSFAVIHGIYISSVLGKLLHAPPELLFKHGTLLEEYRRFLQRLGGGDDGKGKDAQQNAEAALRRKLTLHDIMLCLILSSNKGTPHLVKGEQAKGVIA